MLIKSILSICLIFIINNVFARMAYIEYDKTQLKAIVNKSQQKNYNNIPVLILSGNKLEMGMEYGARLKRQMEQVLNILEDYYISKEGLTYKQLVEQGDLLYNSYPKGYKDFIQGIAIGSGGELSLNDVKVLNAMETLGALLPINNNKKVLATHNQRNKSVESMLIRMLAVLQDSSTLNQAIASLSNKPSDFSLIINMADKNDLASLEFSSDSAIMHYYYPDKTMPFASTNFFMAKAWANTIPIPTDELTWLGVTRRDNLMKLVSNTKAVDIEDFKQILVKDIVHGGAVNKSTIYSYECVNYEFKPG